MKKLFIFSLILSTLTHNIYCNSILNNVSISGTYLGLFNIIENNQSQFDYATNIDFNYTISEEVSGIIQLQTGAGNGSIDFEGPEAVLTDITLEYAPKNMGLNVTFGSFDVPFGHETDKLTNNADTFNNIHFFNSLPYSALAGAVGTLNTLGIKTEYKLSNAHFISSITNGTSETANNNNNTFQTTAQLSLFTNENGYRLTTSILNSDDSNDTAGTSLNSNLTAYLLEFDLPIDVIKLNINYGNFNFDDNTDSTTDSIKTFGIGISTQLKSLFAGIKSSFWRPDGATMSTSAPTVPGLLSSTSTSANNDQYQLSIGYHLSKHSMIRTEYIINNYLFSNSTTQTTAGFISGINVRF